MRIPADMPRRRPAGARRRGVLIGIGAAVLLLLLLSRALAGFYTDALWFQDLGFGEVFYGVLGTKLLLAAAFCALAFALVLGNLLIAERLAPRGPRRGPEDELVQRYREVVGGHAGKLRVAVAVLLALILGIDTRSRWEQLLLWRNGGSFGGARDPQFGKDVGFYVFELPFRTFVTSWLLWALIATTVVTAGLHYLNGGIRLQAVQHRGATPQVKAHLSVLLALVAFVKAYDYWLDRYQLVYSTRGFAQGAFYTDVKAKLPALTLLTLISVAAGVLLLANIWRRGFALPAVSVGLWLFVTILVGSAYPALIQQLRVKPNAAQLEAPYIRRNIEGTRRAFALDQVEVKPFSYTEAPGAVNGQTLADDEATVRNIRLWDPAQNISRETWSAQQSLRSQFQVLDVDIDRYTIEGRKTQVVVATRELRPEGIPQDNWVNRHLQYTHGYGAIIAPANATSTDGLPQYTLKDLPPDPELAQPRIYVGEQGDKAGVGDYAVVGTKQDEVDFQDNESKARTFTYDGRHGVTLTSSMRRLAFALRFQEPNLLLSSAITPQSRVLYFRGVAQRVRKVAPFLTLDSDPYPVVLRDPAIPAGQPNGRIVWVLDAYTTTDRFPYSESVGSRGRLTGINYARNSVKAVVDAYDGTVQLFAVDEEDPLLRAYAKSFPKAFTPASELPLGLAEHFRYPEDLFGLQADLFGRYHIDDPVELFRATDRWAVSPDPGVRTTAEQPGAAVTTQPPAPGQAPAPPIQLTRQAANRIPATYQLLKLPDERQESFVLTVPYVPFSRTGQEQRAQLTAFLTARSDPGQYGKLTLYQMPTDQQINGPTLVDANILADTVIARELTLLDTAGSEVLFGNILLVPVDRSIVYIRPLYVRASRTNSLPRLERVIAVYGSRAVINETLQGALTDLFGAAPPTLEEPGGSPPTSTPGTPGTPEQPGTPNATPPVAADLIRRADAAFVEAQAALRAGDLATYQRKVDEAAGLVRQAAGGGAAAPPPPPSTTTTVASG